MVESDFTAGTPKATLQPYEQVAAEESCSPCKSPSVMSAPDMSPECAYISDVQENGDQTLVSSTVSRTRFQRPMSSGCMSKDAFEFAPLPLIRASKEQHHPCRSSRSIEAVRENNDVQEAQTVSRQELNQYSKTDGHPANSLVSQSNDPVVVAKESLGQRQKTSNDLSMIGNGNFECSWTIHHGGSPRADCPANDTLSSKATGSTDADNPSTTVIPACHPRRLERVLTLIGDNSYRLGNANDKTDSDEKDESAGLSPMQSKDFRTQMYTPDRQRAINSHFRVTKTSAPQTHRTKNLARNSRSPPAYSTGALISRSPSEEDLLLIIMHRYRSKNNELSELQNENTYLKGELQLARQDLDQANDKCRVKAVADQKAHEEVLLFQARYRKIKAWALEFNHEYANLQQQSIELRDQVSDMKKDCDILHEMTTSSRAVQNRVEADQQRLQDQREVLQSSFEALQSDYDDLKTRYETINSELQSERTFSKKLEIHVSHVWKSQSSLNRETTSQLNEINNTLEKLSDQSGLKEDFVSKFMQSEGYSDLLQKISEQEQTSRATGVEVVARLAALSDIVASLPKESTTKEDLLRLVEDDGHSHDMKLASLHQEIKQLQSSVTENFTSRETTCRLEEQLSSALRVEAMLQKDKTMAQQRIETLESSQRTLLESTMKSRDINAESFEKFFSTTQGKFADLTNTCSTTSAILKRSEDHLKKVEDENAHLHEQLRLATISKDTQIMEMEDVHQQELTALQDQADWTDIVANVELQEQIETRDRSIYRLQRELSIEEACHAVSEQELDQLRRYNHDLKFDVRAAGAKVLHLEQQLTDKEVETKEFNTKLQQARSNADGWEMAQVQLKSCTEEMAVLRDQNAVLSECKVQLSETVSENVKIKQEVIQLQKKLQAAKLRADAIEDLELKLSDLQEGMTIVCEELQIAKMEADKVESLKKLSTQSNEELVSLKKALEIAQARSDKVDELEREKADLQAQVSDMQQELTEASKKIAAQSELWAISTRGRDDELKTLSQNLTDVHVKLDHANAVNENKSKDVCQLRAQIETMEGRQGSADRYRCKVPETISTQELLQLTQGSIQLSIAGIDIPDSQLVTEQPLRDQSTTDSQRRANESCDTDAIDPQLTILKHCSERHRQHDLESLESAVPESQQELSVALEIPETLLADNLSSSSPSDLTDLIEESGSTLTQPLLRAAERWKRPDLASPIDDHISESSSSQKVRWTRQCSRQSPLRPNSAASQESMLLETTPRMASRSGPTGRSAPRSHHASQNGQSGSTAATPHKSPRYDEVDELVVLQSTTEVALDGQERERHRPNSAVKRRHEGSNDGLKLDQKRLKRNPGNLSLQIPCPDSGPSLSGSRLRSLSKSKSSISAGSYSGSVVNAPALASGSSQTQRKSTRRTKTSKSERYSQRFGSNT